MSNCRGWLSRWIRVIRTCCWGRKSCWELMEKWRKQYMIWGQSWKEWKGWIRLLTLKVKGKRRESRKKYRLGGSNNQHNHLHYHQKISKPLKLTFHYYLSCRYDNLQSPNQHCRLTFRIVNLPINNLLNYSLSPNWSQSLLMITF